MDDNNNVAIIGSGGIGCYLAGDLVQAGRAVTVCARTPFEGLRIDSGGRTRRVDVRVASEPKGAHPAGWVLLTTKAQDTAGAAPWMEQLVRPGTKLVVVQNGIGQRERGEAIARGARVVPAVIYCSVERVAPGRVVHHGGARLVVPRDEASPDLVRLFEGTTFAVEETHDFATVAWRKLLSNLVGNPITALTLRRTGVLREPRIRELAAAILAEALAVAPAEGARLAEADADHVLAGLDRHGSEAGTSMLYDRLAGRTLEHRYLTGALVEAADRHGIPVPVNRTLLALLDAVSGQKLEEVS